MNITISILKAALLGLLLAVPPMVMGQFTYTTTDGKVTITGYSDSGGNVDIPDTLDGQPVVAIGRFAFAYCSGLTSVTIPDTVTSIESNAFYYCSSMTSMTIPNSVISIGAEAFYYCSSLTNVTIPGNVTSIGGGAFTGCSRLVAINVDPLNVNYSSLAGVLFNKSQSLLIQYPCSAGGNYTIPDTVTSIGAEAFYYCSSLTNMTIPNSVISIGAKAFFYCTSLTNVTIPGSVTSIGGGAFNHCTSLVAFNVDPLNAHYSSLAGVLFNKAQSLLIQYPCSVGGSYTIPNSVTSIGDSAFCSCSRLTSVTIPDGITSIGDNVFSGCSRLTSVTIPNSVTSIGDSAFLCCFGLTKVTIPASVASIGDSAFSFCSGLTSVTILDGVNDIGDSAFTLCSGLTNVTIPASVASIGHYAFSQCSKLQSAFFLGNAPAIIWGSPFESSTNVCYYLSGKSGWGDTYGGRPAYLWNPAPQATISHCSIGTGGFSLSITGDTSLGIAVEATTNLAGGQWDRLQVCTLSNGAAYFCDPAWTNHPQRFYRISAP